VGGDEPEHCDSDILARRSDHCLVLRHQPERTPGAHHHIHCRFCDRSECNNKRKSGCDLRSDGRLLGCSRCVRFGRSGQCQMSIGSVECEKIESRVFLIRRAKVHGLQWCGSLSERRSW
jgi:hypothetical protein